MWHVSRAKAQNKKVVHIKGPLITHGAANDFTSAMNNATLVIADLVGEATTYDTYDIYTSQKVKIRERLGPYQNTPVWDGAPLEFPKSLLPIQTDEFIITEPFGTIEIAGVTLTSVDESQASLPPSEPRLMFVQFWQGGIAGLQFGRYGVFSIMPDGKLRAKIDANKNPLKKDIDLRFDGRLDRVRASLRQ